MHEGTAESAQRKGQGAMTYLRAVLRLTLLQLHASLLLPTFNALRMVGAWSCHPIGLRQAVDDQIWQ